MAVATVEAMAVIVVTVVAVVTMVLVATVVVWRRATAMAASLSRKSSGRGRRGRESARGEMAQRCRRVVCTRDLPHS